MEIFIAIIFGIAITIVCYETYYEKREEMVQKLLPQKIDILVEASSKEISKKRKEFGRELTEDEKTEILDKCYQDI